MDPAHAMVRPRAETARCYWLMHVSKSPQPINCRLTRTFDSVICRFGAMGSFANKSLREILRVLKPAARMALAVACPGT